jgi:thioredoxin reductase (NADPH)
MIRESHSSLFLFFQSSPEIIFKKQFLLHGGLIELQYLHNNINSNLIWRNENMFDVVVIGAGPAGGSAALFAAKAGKKTLIIENGKSITKKAWMENHYSVMEISGPDMVEMGKKQASKFGAEIIEATVTNVVKTDNGFSVETDENKYEAKHVIVATGLVVDLAEKVGLTTKPGTEPRVKTVLDVDADGKTNIVGIWAAGAVAGVSLHTIITAGDGAKVAINVISEMNGERYVDHDILKS